MANRLIRVSFLVIGAGAVRLDDDNYKANLEDAVPVRSSSDHDPAEADNLVLWDGATNGAIIASPGTIAGTANGWSHSASASRHINQDDGIAGISFKASTGTSHAIIGWTSMLTTGTSGYSSADFGVCLRGSWRATTPEIFERGSQKYNGTLSGNGKPSTDVWSIEVNSNSQVEYKRNGLVYYTSSRTVEYPWHAFIDVYTSASPSTVNQVRYVAKATTPQPTADPTPKPTPDPTPAPTPASSAAPTAPSCPGKNTRMSTQAEAFQCTNYYGDHDFCSTSEATLKMCPYDLPLCSSYVALVSYGTCLDPTAA